MRHGGYRSSDLMYQGKHHGDVFFRGRFMEKMYIENDECDGLVWEKLHSDDAILCITSWYPGYYSSTSYQGTRLIQQDPRMPYVTPGAAGGDCFMRTKDFIISKVGSYYYAPTGSYAVSRDGKKWTKRIGGAPTNWLGSTFGWSVKENVGILAADGKIYRFDIDDSGKLTWTAIADDLGASAYCGDIVSQGIVQDGTHQWYRFRKANGELYTSKLPDHYTFSSFNQDGSITIVDGTYEWSFYYLNGKYIAFTTSKRNSNHWVGPGRYDWEYWYDVLYVESDDGFKTIRSKYFDSPRLTYAYQYARLLYFNKKYLMYERGETVSRNVRTPYFWVWDFGNSYFNTPKKIVVPQTYTVPMVGMSSDQNVDSVTVVMYGNVPAQNRNYQRGIDSFNSSTVYIKDGKPSEPYGGIIIPTAFKPNGWSSNAYDEGGWVYLDGGLLRAPKRGIAYGGSNYMVDRDNATWGSDYFKLTIKGANNKSIKITEEDVSYNPYSYTIKKDASDYIKYFKFHFNKVINAKCGDTTLSRSLRREGKTILDFRSFAYNETSEYYFDDVGEFTHIQGRQFLKINPGKSYCFSLEYDYGNNHYRGQSPLVISMDEFPTVYDAGGWGIQRSISVIEYEGITWYYAGFAYGFNNTNEPDSPRYIDLYGMGKLSEQELVKECIRRAHGI